MKEAFENPTANRRRYHQARTVETYLDSDDRPYIFLLDGGVADNIGARRLLADVIDAVQGGVQRCVQKLPLRDCGTQCLQGCMSCTG